MNNKINKWNTRYQAEQAAPLSCKVLAEHGYLLPKDGTALDLACGMAGNAFYLAANGLAVDAIDISPVAIEKVTERAQQAGLPVRGILRDVESEGLPERMYDVIVVGFFLNRDLFPQIINHLNPYGLLYYQTWTAQKTSAVGPRNPDYLLGKGELLRLCDDLTILFYQEDGLVGDLSQGLRNQASIIALRE